MTEVKLRDFMRYLEKGKEYAFVSDVTKSEKIPPEGMGIEVYFLKDVFEGAPIIVLPYTYEEWSKFLEKHNCDMAGDYMVHTGHNHSYNRVFHEEEEDGIKFKIACGKDPEEDVDCDWFMLV